jgi:hypothetical protein
MSMSKRARARSRPRPTSCRPTRTRACRTARSKARTWWVETIAATIAAARQCEVIVVELGASNTVSDRGLVHGQGSKQLRLGLRVAPLLDPDLGLVAQVGGKDCRVRIVLGIGSDRLFQQGTRQVGAVLREPPAGRQGSRIGCQSCWGAKGFERQLEGVFQQRPPFGRPRRRDQERAQARKRVQAVRMPVRTALLLSLQRRAVDLHSLGEFLPERARRTSSRARRQGAQIAPGRPEGRRQGQGGAKLSIRHLSRQFRSAGGFSSCCAESVTPVSSSTCSAVPPRRSALAHFVNDNRAHHAGGVSEEPAPMGELESARVQKAKVRLVHQRGGVQQRDGLTAPQA